MPTQTKIDHYFSTTRTIRSQIGARGTFHDQYQRLMTGPATALGVLTVLDPSIRLSIYEYYFNYRISSIELRPETFVAEIEPEVEYEYETEKEEDTDDNLFDDEDEYESENEAETEVEVVLPETDYEYCGFAAISLVSRQVYLESSKYKFTDNLELDLWPETYNSDPQIPYRLPAFLRHRITSIFIGELVEETKQLDCSKFPNLAKVTIQATFDEDDNLNPSRWDVETEGTGAEVARINKRMAWRMYHLSYEIPLKNFKDDLYIVARGFRVDSKAEREYYHKKR